MTTALNPRPQVHPGSPWRFPSPSCQTLSNGLEVVRVPMPGQRIISVEAGLDAPLTAEPQGSEGVAALVVRTADESTAGHPGAGFAEAMESIGATYDGSAGLTSSHVGVDVPVTRVGAAVDLFMELLTRTSLDEADIARQVDAGRASLAQIAQRGGALAGLAVARATWTQGSRRRMPTIGTTSSLENLDADAAGSFWRGHWGPSGGVLVVAGERADELDLSAFEEWSGGTLTSGDSGAGHASLIEQTASDGRGPRVVLVDRPEAVQADVRLQQCTCGRLDPGWAELRVAAGALGGTFASRLNRVLREEKGWSYGVGMSVQPSLDAGLAVVSGAFRTEVAADAVAEALRILTTGPDLTEEEVSSARDHAVGVAPLQYDSSAAVAHQVAALVRAGLPADWVDDHLAAMAQVRAGSGEWNANRAWHELLPAHRWRIGVSGRASDLAPALESCGFDVTVVTPAEVLG